MTNTLTIIQWEYHSIESVVRTISYFMNQMWLGKSAPVNKVYRAMLQVSDLFAEHLLHPNEDRHLFRRLRLGTHRTDELLDFLEASHRSRVEQRGTSAHGFISVYSTSTYHLIAGS